MFQRNVKQWVVLASFWLTVTTDHIYINMSYTILEGLVKPSG